MKLRTPLLLALTAALAAPPLAAALQLMEVGRVVLAVVTDTRGRAIVDLELDDFVIEEDDKAQEVFGVRVADYPVTILLDNGLDARADFASLKAAAARFIARIGERAVALGTLANPPAMLSSFEDDRETALARIEDLQVSPTRVLMPLDAVALAAQHIQRTGTPFSAIVVIAARPIAATQPESIGLLRPIFESRAFVHAVIRQSPGTTPRGRGPLGAPRLDGNLVRDLSEQTGGHYTTVFSAPSYAVALDRLADRMAGEVMVEYLVAGADAPGNVRVGVRIPGARVRGLGVSR